ncbi:MAG: Omp28-related outer membrane protein [Bacteroidia bacterium]
MTSRILVTLIFSIVFSGFSQAQSAYRHILLEHFTNTRCVLCPARNAELYTLLDQYPDQIHHISIHPSVPYNNCVLYLHNPVDNNARKDLYGVNATPRAFLWGVSSSAGTTLLPEATFLNSRGQTAELGITVTENRSGALPEVTVNVRTFEMPDSGEYRLFAAVAERQVTYQAPNGETNHRNVLRMMLPNSGGELFEPGDVGTVTSFTYSFTPDVEWNMSEIYVIAFVQNINTRKVVNCATEADLKLEVKSYGDGSVEAVVEGGMPPYEIRWNDPDSQQTAFVSGLPNGLYKVTVADIWGVTLSDTVRVGTVTDVEPGQESFFSVFPIPAREEIRILSHIPLYKAIITDLSGRNVGEWEGGSSHEIQIDISHLAPAIYTLRVVASSGESRNTRIVRQ